MKLCTVKMYETMYLLFNTVNIHQSESLQDRKTLVLICFPT